LRAEESRLWRDEIKKRWTSPPEEFNLIEKKETPEEGNAYALIRGCLRLNIIEVRTSNGNAEAVIELILTQVS
jgi:hypothetical protein